MIDRNNKILALIKTHEQNFRTLKQELINLLDDELKQNCIDVIIPRIGIGEINLCSKNELEYFTLYPKGKTCILDCLHKIITNKDDFEDQVEKKLPNISGGNLRMYQPRGRIGLKF